jgi:hypothetical protein
MGKSTLQKQAFIAFSLQLKMFIFSNLKGQCYEMVVEVRPWSGSLDLN